MQKRTGFTLIELLVVVAIIGILATVVIVNLTSAREKAKLAKTRSNIKQFMTIADLYWTNKGYYPNDDAFNNNLSGADSELKSLAGNNSFVDGWNNGMDWDNWCIISPVTGRYYPGSTSCPGNSDRPAGPIGIHAFGPDAANNGVGGDDVLWGARGYYQYRWTD